MADRIGTEALLAERKSTHGEYSEHARCTQGILRVLQAERGYPLLSDMQKETFHMIAHKMGRVVTGNPDVADHWDDISGYAMLISQRLNAPIAPLEIDTNVGYALALAWNCSYDEAVQRLKEIPQKLQPQQPPEEEPEAPFFDPAVDNDILSDTEESGVGEGYSIDLGSNDLYDKNGKQI